MRRSKVLWLAVVCALSQLVTGSAQSLTWRWSNPQPHGNDIVDMAWNGSLGVQVCELGQVYTSPDLINWLPQNSKLTNDLEAVTFFGNRIVITGANGAVAYSDDGVNFTAGSLNTTNWIVSVAASSNLVVAVGDNGALYTSTNGASWQLQSPPPDLGPYWLLSVAYGNGAFVITGEAGYIATSPNGTSWTVESIWEGYGDLEDVSWVNGNGSATDFPYRGFWTVSDTGYAFYSTDNGTSWSQFDPPNSTNVLYTCAADNLTGLLAGDSVATLGTVISNQLSWADQIGASITSAPPWTYFTSVIETNGAYALAGYDGMTVQSYLTNGNYNWTTPVYSPRDWLWQITADAGLYVAVGDNARIMTSSDGADWTVEEVPLTNSVSLSETVFLCVGGDTNLLVAAGTQGSLAVSPNFLYPLTETNSDGSTFTNNASALGVVWYSLTAPAGTTNDLAGVCCWSNRFYLVGGNGSIFKLNFTNWASLDTNNLDAQLGGTNWVRTDSSTTNDLASITTFTNGLLVAGGDSGEILTSPDGLAWTHRSSGTSNGIVRVRCVNDQLLAVGENGTLLTSTTGMNWTADSSGQTNWLTDAIAISNLCYVVGNNGTVLTSSNLVDWTSIGTITGRSLEGVASQNGQLITVGEEGSILRSQVIPITTPVNIIDFAQSSGVDVFSIAGVVGQQFTLDSSTNLIDWITGPLLDLISGDGSLIFYQSLPTNPPAAQFYRCTLAP